MGWSLVGFSLLVHLVTVYCFARQPDSFAAFTVIPFWFWGGIGLFASVFAFWFLRAPLSLILTGVWVTTLLVGMDEARVLANFGHPPLEQERKTEGDFPLLRVATANCAFSSLGDPAQDLKKWDPDVILLQEVHSSHVRRFAESMYGGGGQFRAYMTNGLVTRHEIVREVRNPQTRNQQITIRLRDGREVEFVNLHLDAAATDMRLWRADTWRTHKNNRKERREELSTALQVLERTSSFPRTPTILGGDFNASSSDVSHRLLARDFEDAFSAVGRGWGNTFHRRFPILRIDHLYATRQITPIGCRVVVTKASDHRMVVADFIVRD